MKTIRFNLTLPHKRLFMLKNGIKLPKKFVWLINKKDLLVLPEWSNIEKAFIKAMPEHDIKALYTGNNHEGNLYIEVHK